MESGVGVGDWVGEAQEVESESEVGVSQGWEPESESGVEVEKNYDSASLL